MSQLLVIGAGGHGRVVADAALSTGAWRTVSFVDDRTDVSAIMGIPIVATVAQLDELYGPYTAAIVGLGNAQVRLQLLERCERIGFELPSIFHRTATVSPFASIAAGCVVCAQGVVNPGAVIERGCIVNTAASVDHDCRLGEGVHLSPGAHLGGDVHIGPRTWIGIGSCVKHGVRIGSDVIVGAGAAVIGNIADQKTVVGVPAREK